MKYIECPEESACWISGDPSVFLAGSITGAKNWQKEAAVRLSSHFHVFNPRRAKYDVLQPGMEEEQIDWEYRYLRLTNYLFFYFSFETVAPITLLEYGAALERDRNQEIFVAIHPEYKRKNDVLIQSRLKMGEIFVEERICFDLNETLEKLISLG